MTKYNLNHLYSFQKHLVKRVTENLIEVYNPKTRKQGPRALLAETLPDINTDGE